MSDSLEKAVSRFSDQFYERHDDLFEGLAKSIVENLSLANVSNEEKTVLVKKNLIGTVKLSELYVRELSHVVNKEINKKLNR